MVTVIKLVGRKSGPSNLTLDHPSADKLQKTQPFWLRCLEVNACLLLGSFHAAIFCVPVLQNIYCAGTSITSLTTGALRVASLNRNSPFKLSFTHCYLYDCSTWSLRWLLWSNSEKLRTSFLYWHIARKDTTQLRSFRSLLDYVVTISYNELFFQITTSKKKKGKRPKRARKKCRLWSNYLYNFLVYWDCKM